MKFRLLELLRCADCRSPLGLLNPGLQCVERLDGAKPAKCSGLCPFPEIVRHPRDCAVCIGYEVMAGTLRCVGCGRSYIIEDGIPRLCQLEPGVVNAETLRTASSYGYLWTRSVIRSDADGLRPYHFERMARDLSFPEVTGLVLDVGCGDGIDLANNARRPGVEIVGVELSEGGCRTSFKRSLIFPGAHTVQADACRLPFDDDCFDFAYSYGVLHHLSSPEEGAQELLRVLKPRALVAGYLYEDFSDRAVGWRWLLAAVTLLRRVTRRVPHAVLFRSCQVASPVTYALFVVPFRILRRVPGLRLLAAGFPFRHARGAFSLAGDLYDRFSTPIEWRYTRTGAMALLEGAGFQTVRAVQDRGWIVTGTKPSPKRPEQF